MKNNQYLNDRFINSLNLTFKNLKLIIPVFLLNILPIIGLLVISIIFLNIFDSQNKDIIDIITFFIIFGVLYIIYLLFSVIITLGTYKNIKDLIIKGKYKLNNTFIYGFNNLLYSFKTYFFVFLYIYLYPVIFVLIGGIASNIYIFTDLANSLMKTIFITSFLAFLLFIFFSIYRGIKAYFVIPAAVDSYSYTKTNFNKAIQVTKNNWGRIAGNVIILGIIGYIIGSFINILNNSITVKNTIQEKVENKIDINSSKYTVDNEKFLKKYPNNLLGSLYVFFRNLLVAGAGMRIKDSIANIITPNIVISSISSIIINFFSIILSSIYYLFSHFFIYLFYKRLKYEYENNLN